MRNVGGEEKTGGATRMEEQRGEAADSREAAVTLNVAGPGVAASIVRLTNAISIRLEDDLKAKATSSSHSELAAARRQQYEFISAQVSREDGLVHQRMTWALQLDGLLFVALALIQASMANEGGNATVAARWLVDFLLAALPLAGLGITVAGWLGVRAADRQLRYLRGQYAEDVDDFARDNKWPKPFGDSRSLLDGAAAIQLSFAALCFFWLWLAAHRAWPAAVESYSHLFVQGLARIAN